jgi:hypothetical protein
MGTISIKRLQFFPPGDLVDKNLFGGKGFPVDGLVLFLFFPAVFSRLL